MDGSRLELEQEQEHRKALAMLQRRNERLKSDNLALAKELADSTNHAKRSARSPGFDDVQGAQITFDTVDYKQSYVECLENIQRLTMELAAKRDETEELRKNLEAIKQENTVLRLKLRDNFLSQPEFPLDADTTDYLLTLLPSVSDLQSLILTSRSIYQVFQARSDSIVHAVVSNQIGSVLPQALRLARCEDKSLRQQDVEDLPNEDNILAQSISRNEAILLVRNHKVVQVLEDNFSWRHKDRKSRTSVLTYKESKRFKRAMYRVMLLSFMYGMDSFSGQMTEEDRPSEMSALCRSRQWEFLNRFDSDNLNQIQTVSYFLHRMVNWVFSASSDGDILAMINIYDLNGLYLSAGPRFILGCYNKCSSRLSEGPQRCIDENGENGPYIGFIVSSADDILKERGVRVRNLPRIILDLIEGHSETDKCTHCDSMFEWRRGVHLWNETNWDYLKGRVGYDLHHQFKGKLWSNRSETGFRAALRNINYPVLMNELFEIRPDDYKAWTKQNWTCFDCLRQFITDILPFWWLGVKRKGPNSVEHICLEEVSDQLHFSELTHHEGLYGYDCSDQIDLEHADLYNHLCTPVEVAPDRRRNFELSSYLT